VNSASPWFVIGWLNILIVRKSGIVIVFHFKYTLSIRKALEVPIKFDPPEKSPFMPIAITITAHMLLKYICHLVSQPKSLRRIIILKIYVSENSCVWSLKRYTILSIHDAHQFLINYIIGIEPWRLSWSIHIKAKKCIVEQRPSAHTWHEIQVIQFCDINARCTIF